MTSIDQRITNSATVMSKNIEAYNGDRELLSQNMLAQARNLVEGMLVRHHKGVGAGIFSYDDVEPAKNFARPNGKVSFLVHFHKELLRTTSHYTWDGDNSERLMLKYYAYLLRIRELANSCFGLRILDNLEDFPFNTDPALTEYHQKIANRVDEVSSSPSDRTRRARYYIHAVRPFFVSGRIFYEVTFFEATNNVSKFDRVIGFTRIDLTDKYSANLTLHPASIEVQGQTMPIVIIGEWQVSIRPCEIENYARLFGQVGKITSNSEYKHIMSYLTESRGCLLDFIDMSDSLYSTYKTKATSHIQRPRIFPMLDEARRIIRGGRKGANVLRYLMYSMNNQIIKSQYTHSPSTLMSGLYLKNGCNPFDTMPFCTSLIRHNPRFADLADSLDLSGRAHELLGRCVKNNAEDRGMIYTPEEDLTVFGNTEQLIAIHNQKLWRGHRPARNLVKDKGHVFLQGYEDETVRIIEHLKTRAARGIRGFETAAKQWLAQAVPPPDDQVKIDALQKLFTQSEVVLIYGAAGTGKSTMIDLIARYFHGKSMLFLAHTHPAVDNMKRKVNSPGAPFRTIARHIAQDDQASYDVLFIDECSTVSNTDMLKVLEKTNFKLLVLVGDTFQIEAIQFGDWFGLARSFMPETAVFELTTPHRNKNPELLDLWTTVREIKSDITETLLWNNYVAPLNATLFEPPADDEIVLALNYDGLYGINNINRFLQSSNPACGVDWGVNTYKVGDPVLFNETQRFRGIIWNNLKGRIVSIRKLSDRIVFDVWLDRPITAFDVDGTELQYVTDQTVRFDVFERGTGDDDDDSLNRTVPFQVAYAVSIHKAQGLEYNSVKVVITEANEEDITHSIFYTAITRAREKLRIYWSPGTQQTVLESLRKNKLNGKDIGLLRARRSL